MIDAIGTGFVLGISAGFSPGPLMTLVVAHTLQHGTREGIKIAMAPLFTDLPIIIVATLLLSRLSNSQHVLGTISICGAVFILYLGIASWRANVPQLNAAVIVPQSLAKGVLVNFLSPNPYLFWLTVGAPTLVTAWQRSIWATAGFLIVFYAGLIGGKVTCSLVAGRSRQWLSGNGYRNLMRILGILLVCFAVRLAFEGIRRLQ